MKSALFALAAAFALMLAPLPASPYVADGTDFSFSNSEPRDEQGEKIACSQSLLQPPAGLDVECERYPLSNSNCYKQGYGVESKPGQPSIFVFAMTHQKTDAAGCAIHPPQSVRENMVMAIKKYRPFVHDDATNWSRKPFELKHAGLALLFDSPNKDRDGKCVAFYQPGVHHVFEPYLRHYYVRGWICVPPGLSLTKAEAYDLIKSFKVAVTWSY